MPKALVRIPGFFLLGCLAGLVVPLAPLRGEDAPIRMAPHPVVEWITMNLELRFRYAYSSAGQWIDSIKVANVKSGSLAKRGGLAKGTEILAIQGHFVHGLSKEELGRLLIQDEVKTIVLLVRDSAAGPQREVRFNFSSAEK